MAAQRFEPRSESDRLNRANYRRGIWRSPARGGSPSTTCSRATASRPTSFATRGSTRQTSASGPTGLSPKVNLKRFAVTEPGIVLVSRPYLLQVVSAGSLGRAFSLLGFQPSRPPLSQSFMRSPSERRLSFFPPLCRHDRVGVRGRQEPLPAP